MRTSAHLRRRRPAWLIGDPVGALVAAIAGLAWLGQAPPPASAAPAGAALAFSAPTYLNAGLGYGPTTLTGVSCPSGTLCVAVDSLGREVAFSPTDPSAWSAYQIDGSRALNAVSCIAPSRCVAVSVRGDAISFDPLRVGAVPRAHAVDPHHELTAVACPRSDLCVALDAGGRVVSFNPQTGATLRQARFGETSLIALACPTQTQCTALDSGRLHAVEQVAPERMLTFDPQTLAVLAVIPVPATIDATALACPAAGECVGAGSTVCPTVPAGQPSACSNSGASVTFNPQTATNLAVSTRSQVGYLALACISASLCTAMDRSGTEVSFDPAAAGTLAQSLVDPLGDWPKGYNPSLIACLPAGGCVVAARSSYGSGAVSAFAPLAAGSAALVPVDDGGPVAALACPAHGACVALANTEGAFDPSQSVEAVIASPAARHVSAVDSFFGAVSGLACPQRNRCVGLLTLPAFASSCGCARVGTAVAFDPAGPAHTYDHNARIDAARLTGVSCPAARECVAVDTSGLEQAFNPARPLVRTPHRVLAGPLSAVACPSAGQCTAVSGRGFEVTFAPRSGAFSSRRIDLGGRLAALACPTTSQCTATDSRGRELTFDPLSPTPPLVHQAARAGLNAIACPSTSWCIAVSGAGTVVTGNPAGGGRLTVSAVPGASALLSVACRAVRACTVGDSIGQTFTTMRSPARVAAILGR